MEPPALTPARQCEPIAIVGIGCRLPGKASSPSKLWELLIRNETGYCAVPPERYNAAAYYHPDAERPGSINSTGGYFIQTDIRSFENAFFGINNLEATSMDAQQRKLLEVTYEALENAGVPLEKVYGSKTGVYVGNYTNDFMIMQYRDPEYLSRYTATGSGLAVLANRITHCFDLRGPSHVVDTACSSSLYALHSACLALDAQDCDAAIVASANLIQSPEQQMVAVRAGILSQDSMCHTFDERANGYGRAEGVSAVYLKRMGDALRDGDPIRSIIRGTSVNGNGRTPGIVQPSVEGQKAVIRAAYRRAGLDLGDTAYVETHGTGTRVGDPIEIEAIAGVLRHRTGRPTLVGGNKPNLGHSEGASGLSNLIKVTLALENGVIPGTVGVKNINPSIKTKEWNVNIVTANQPWPVSHVPRASVNSFGFGGSNSHAILEAVQGRPLANGRRYSPGDGNAEKLYLLPLSARSRTSAEQMASNLADYISHSAQQINIEDLAFTLTCRRSKLPTRGFFIESQASLDKGIDRSRLNIADSDTAGPFPLAFVYTGQGAQWDGMGKELLSHSSIFRKAIRYLDSCLQTLAPEHVPGWTLEGCLQAGENSDINAAEMSQPLCTAVQIALTDLLRDWGALPELVTGHSSGEIGAAYAAGTINARQAIFASYFRGTVVAESSTEGAMAAVGLGKDQAQAIIGECALTESITVACANSPESTTVSGDKISLDRLFETFQQRAIWFRLLETGGKAYHSHHMRILGPKYQALLERYWETPDSTNYVNGSMDGQVSSVVMVSTVTGNPASTSLVGRPEYWRTNLESPVGFEEAMKFILGRGNYHLVELGPHSALRLPIKQNASTPEKGHYIYNSALIRHQDARLTTLQLLGSLFLHGHDELQYHKTFAERYQPHVLVDLPPYPWDYSSPILWSEPRATTEFRNRKYPRHELLGSQVCGGSTVGVTWRNVLCLNETEWLAHHCLGPSVVVPAAAYIAMAVEAMCQVAGLQLEDCPGVELRDLNFIKALDMDPERRPNVEIFTEMQSMMISNLVNSARWWRFNVVSVDNSSRPTLHMNAIVRVAEASPRTTRQIKLDKSNMQQDAVRVWYDKFIQEGLSWGPQFAVMEKVFRDRTRTAHEAAATTHLRRGEPLDQYIAHPVSIDAMLQTAFVATTGGCVSKLRATVPVSMDSVYVAPPSTLDMDTEKPWYIDTESERVGFEAVKINAELFNSSGQVLIRMGQARCVAYQGSRQMETTEQRNPLVRAAWKPDLTMLTSTGLDEYLTRFTQECGSTELVDEGLLRLAGALDLACHRQCNSNILELGDQVRISDAVRGLLRAGTPFRRYNSYSCGVFKNGDLVGTEVFAETADEQMPENPTGIPKERKFDIVLVPSVELWTPALASRLTPGATVIARGDAFSDYIPWNRVIKGAGLLPVTVATTSVPTSKAKANKTLAIVVTRHNEPSRLDIQLQKVLQARLGCTLDIISLSQVSPETVPDRSIIISTLEQQQPLLSVACEHEMLRLKIITDRAAKIVWVVNGGLLGGEHPDFAPALGLSRALMLEQPCLQFAVLDVDNKSASSLDTLRNISSILDRLINEPEPGFEFAQRDGVLHISRWEPDERLNETFRLKQRHDTVDIPLAAAGRCELSIKNPGQMDTIHFVHQEYVNALHPDDVEIRVKSIGMNAKDLYALSGKVDTKGACSCECAGVVTAVGGNVSEFKAGDRVVAMAPGNFATLERFPHWAVCKLNDDEDFTTASTIPIVFSTVIYGLKYRANLQPGETILIHSAAGGVGIAALQYAKHLGAKIFVTVGDESKKSFLVDNYGLDPAHIYRSRDSSFLPAIMEATSGQGVDVVLNSLTGDLLHRSFEACADFGRFIEIGKRDILDHGVLDMWTFGRNVSFMAFDLSNIYLSKRQGHHQLWKSLLAESLDLIRSKLCQPCFPIKTFDASDITDAFRHFSLGTRLGKVTVSFQNTDTNIQVIPKRYETTFSSQKYYLMVGCLGGLGRSLSKWIMSCGARRFIFLGRSSTDKPEAQAMVDDLRAQGAHVTVIRGNVCRYEDVERAMEAADCPIGGVIQAAMALDEALWSDMSHDAWHTTIGPKIQGTWNLHNALRRGLDSQLDFFVIASSLSGTVGIAAESNYCAANSFLDAFARYRNRLGLPAISIGYGIISEVGYLHEHPDIEALMKRKGIHPINEEELIRIMDMAIANQQPHTWASRYDHLAGSHLLTGVEFTGLKNQQDQGFDSDSHIFTDPRAALFTASFFSRRLADQSAAHSPNHLLPETIMRGLRDEKDRTSMLDALRALVSRKISNLILLPEGKLEPDQPLGEFGLDSMLAAEFRAFVFRALGVDVPFVVLLKRSTTVNALVEIIAKGLGTGS